MKTLHLTLKKKWFDMILSGEKKEEYREIKPHWTKRLTTCLATCGIKDCNKCGARMNVWSQNYDRVEFRNGYSPDSPTIIVKCHGIDRGVGNPAWGAPKYPVFIIHLGEIIETKNLPSAKPKR